MTAFGIGYVHPGKVHHAFMESVMQTLFEYPRAVLMPRQAGPNLSRFRNDVVRKFLLVEEPKLEGLLFVDTDVIFTPWDVEQIIETPYSITSAVYFNPLPDGSTFPVFNIGTKKLRQGDHDDLKAAGGKPFRVAGVGMGFCYIKRNVLQTLGTGALWPFGEYMNPDGTPVGEDVGFSIRARHHGFDCWVDPQITVRHIKEHELW